MNTSENNKPKIGAPFKFTEEELFQKFDQYINWNKTENLMYKKDIVKSGINAGMVIEIPLIPPLTIVGFCVYIKIFKSTFFDWLNNADSPLNNFATRAKEIIEQNQITGATLELYNPQIVARLNGLNETQPALPEGSQINIQINGLSMSFNKELS